MGQAALMNEPAQKQHRLQGDALREAWDDLKVQQKGVRAREAAETLGVSEAELIASLVGHGATNLRSEGAKIIKNVPDLGPVMALTRNDHAVHEKIGPYTNVSLDAAHGLVLGEKIDLRIFPGQWRHSLALVEETKDGTRRSIQIFNGAGMAVHKIYQKPQTDIVAFDALRASWLAMQDTHEFFGRLRKLKVGRLQAFRHAGEDLARPVAVSSLSEVLEYARDDSVPIMVFVGNPGCIQIHSGPVANLKRMGPWFNVLDPDFNLHLREDAIDSAWIVRKPTRDGDVNSLELFDKDGFCFAQLFGMRKPDIPELIPWRGILAKIPTLEKHDA